MKLKHWMYKNKVTLAQAAKALGVSGQHVSLIRNGKEFPSESLARRIVELTVGEVSYIEARPETAPTPRIPFSLHDHPLARWIEKSNVTVGQMAKSIGITNQYLYKIIKGVMNPSERLCRQIEQFTFGEVKLEFPRNDTGILCPHCNKVIEPPYTKNNILGN